MSISIRFLEQRLILENEIDKLNELLDTTTIYYTDHHQYLAGFGHTFIDFCDIYFAHFPFSGTSRDIEEFFIDRDVALFTDEYYIYLLNLYSNLLSWMRASKDELGIYLIDYNPIAQINERINIILESQNYQNIIDEELNEENFYDVYTVKRNVAIDSILPDVSREVSIDLLSYIDFRVENNIQEKEAIIQRLYKDLELRAKELRLEPNISLFNDTKRALNFSRHNQNNDFSVEQKIKWCDNAFKLYVHLVRANEIKSIREELKKLKS